MYVRAYLPRAGRELRKSATKRRLWGVGITRTFRDDDPLGKLSRKNSMMLDMDTEIEITATYASLKAKAGATTPESRTAATKTKRDLTNIVRIVS